MSWLSHDNLITQIHLSLDLHITQVWFPDLFVSGSHIRLEMLYASVKCMAGVYLFESVWSITAHIMRFCFVQESGYLGPLATTLPATWWRITTKMNRFSARKKTLYAHYCCSLKWIILSQVTNLLKEIEFIFVPFVNPDGYAVCWLLEYCTSQTTCINFIGQLYMLCHFCC